MLLGISWVAASRPWQCNKRSHSCGFSVFLDTKVVQVSRKESSSPFHVTFGTPTLDTAPIIVAPTQDNQDNFKYIQVTYILLGPKELDRCGHITGQCV